MAAWPMAGELFGGDSAGPVSTAVYVVGAACTPLTANAHTTARATITRKFLILRRCACIESPPRCDLFTAMGLGLHRAGGIVADRCTRWKGTKRTCTFSSRLTLRLWPEDCPKISRSQPTPRAAARDGRGSCARSGAL